MGQSVTHCSSWLIVSCVRYTTFCLNETKLVDINIYLAEVLKLYKDHIVGSTKRSGLHTEVVTYFLQRRTQIKIKIVYKIKVEF